MLIRFSVENFRSIRHEAELSMVAVDSDREGVKKHDRLGVGLVPVAGIFGPNASGKSNLLKALTWLRSAIMDSLRDWREKISIQTFKLGETSGLSSFTLELEIDGVRFAYFLDISEKAVCYEALFHYPLGRKKLVFERDGQDLAVQRGLGVLANAKALMTERTLALTAMRKFDENITTSFFKAVANIENLRSAPRHYRILGLDYRSSIELFAKGESGNDADLMAKDRALALLKLADLGISDVQIFDHEVFNEDETESFTVKKANLVHQSEKGDKILDFSEESEGTKAWFKTLAPILKALEKGSVLLFDELDASLHPVLTAQLVQLFENENMNPNGAQLIFTAHDTNLLNELNRDEIWFTQKGRDGGTTLGAISDFAGERVRKSLNLESGYLSGRFGALPDVSNPQILRVLGLIK